MTNNVIKNHVNVAITGAAGQIGYALLFRVASGQMFGPNTTVSLQLLELTPALPSLDGVAMELEDCAFPLLKNVICTDDLSVAMKEVNWALLVGAVPRKDGMERSDLLKINGGIFTAQGKAINDHAADNVKVFVVGNPCNTNCLITMHHAPRVPKDNFYAMTMLDQNRAKAQLAKKANVTVNDITNMAIWGNHSSTQYPDFYNAKINNKPVTEVITDIHWLQDEFVPIIQKRGAAVIKALGRSSAASAANAVVDGVYNLTHATPANDIFSVACYSRGEYGIEEGLLYSFPCRNEAGKIIIQQNWKHNDFGLQKIKISHDELKAERDAVKALGLI